MKKFLIIFFLFNFAASAEVAITEGSYVYSGNISENEACSLAKERAKLKALGRHPTKINTSLINLKKFAELTFFMNFKIVL